MRTFGSNVHVKNTKGHLNKLEDRSQPMVFMGYELGTKGYKFFDPVNFKVIMSRDVIFEEGEKWTWSTQLEGTNSFTFLPDFLPDQSLEEDSASDEEDNAPHDEITSSSNNSEDSHCLRYRSLTDLYSKTNSIPLDEETCLVADEEPLTCLEAAQDEVWRQAMKEEMLAIDRSNTWELESPPSNCKPIGLKWIFKLKKNPKGEIMRQKSRLVVKGYSERKGIDYEEVFAPVVRFETVRALIAIAALKRWMIHHLDVKSTFLNGEIEEVIYIQQPEGFAIEGKEDHVLRLRNALYGLKQALRAWYFKFDKCLISLRFVKSNCEQSLYVKQASMDTLTVGVYVDDLIVTGSSTETIKTFKVEMKKRFKMSDLGSLSSYLALEVRQDNGYIFLSQNAYAQKILEYTKLTKCNAVSTPLEARVKFTSIEESDRVNVTPYRSLIRSLRYLTHTRPDLLYSVGILSRYTEKPSPEHLNAVKRVIRHVKGTADYGLCYKKGESNFELIGYCDSNFAGDVGDRKSTASHNFFLGGMTIKWSSQKQSIVALSSCEAEYIAATGAACQALWMKRLISDLKHEEHKGVKLMVDNQSAITLSKNPVHHNRTKHIDTRYHFIRQCIKTRT